MRLFLTLFAATAAAAAAIEPSPSSDHNGSSFQAQCESFKAKIKVPNANVHSVTYVPAGVNISLADNPSVCGGDEDPITSTFAFCRIALNVTTSSKSQIFMEAWLPSNYSGRFLSTGNGGLGGCM